ncbi:reverse transcriptase [Gossypium australe]|uniref:Reverse transcriptase n=1 Tax=Gossypium australe TaxID=47621 RepID=A0A5B6X5E1_9ROSI|nr:reverse transcriptase [Gossypium australe]
METEFAGLSINEEEDEILQIPSFPSPKKEGGYRLIHDVPAGFYSEALARQLGDFIGLFLKYDGANMGKGYQNFLRVRIQLDVRAQSRKARSKSSIWLREEERGTRGNTLTSSKKDGKQPLEEDKSLMDHDAKEGFLIGVEGKKRQRGDNEADIISIDSNNLLLKDRKMSCGFQNGIDVDSDGSRGGLCLAWHDDATINLQSFSKRHIDVIIEDSEKGSRWRFTGFYGSPYMQDRNESWDLSRNLRNTEELPWLVCRDFNEIMYGHEKKGGLPREERRMDTFRSALVDCHLAVKKDKDRPKRSFKFEAWRMLEESFVEEVRNIWDNSDGDLLQKLEEVRKGMMKRRSNLIFEIEKDKRYWEQRARINWLQFGDKNTTFFHKQATQRRRRNLIQKLQFEDGRETEEICEMEAIAILLISDNVLLAYEILYTLKQKKTEKKGYMVVKLDMSKAYNRVELNFIAAIMKLMGFNLGWVEYLMKCVSTVSYSVVFNGHIGDNFQPIRGLRQGDPLSLFLFLIYGEGLSSLMRIAIQGNILRGVKASRSGPQVSHLLFADDRILFGEATERRALSLKQMLIEYENCSGQYVNYDKSTVFFSTNTQEGDKAIVSRILGVRSSNNPERYLGLPNMSVWAAKGILEKGLCWRIGTGDHISVWDDLWILVAKNDRLQNEDTNEDIKLVSDLIDANNRKWKTCLVLSTFNEDTAKKILQIPLSETIYEDFQAWRWKCFVLDVTPSMKIAITFSGDITASKSVIHSNILSSFAAEAHAGLQVIQSDEERRRALPAGDASKKYSSGEGAMEVKRTASRRLKLNPTLIKKCCRKGEGE